MKNKDKYDLTKLFSDFVIHDKSNNQVTFFINYDDHVTPLYQELMTVNINLLHNDLLLCSKLEEWFMNWLESDEKI